MNSFNVLPIDSEDLGRLYAASKTIDIEDKEQVQYLLGVIEGTLGKYFELDKQNSNPA